MVSGTGNRSRIVFVSLVASAVLVILNTKTSFNSILSTSFSSLDRFNQPLDVHHKVISKASLNHSNSDSIITAVVPIVRESNNAGKNVSVTSVTASGTVQEEKSIPKEEEKKEEEVKTTPKEEEKKEEEVKTAPTEEKKEAAAATPAPEKTSDETKTSAGEEKTNKPLNVVILYPDDVRHDSIGCAGTQPVMTPFLDSLARDGIRFTHNSVTTSICWISRATMFTGQYLARHKSEFLPKPEFCDRWNETWPYLLQKAGYYVGHSGKWQFYNGHFVYNSFNWTSLHEGQHWYPWPDGSGGKNGKPLYQHACDKSEGEVVQFIKDRPKDRPFAVTVAFYPPKAIGIGAEQWFPKNETKALYENMTIPEPYRWNESWWKLPSFFRPRNEARTRWQQRFGTYELYQNSMKCYYALITEVDKACENIVAELKRQGIYEETMIIFTADNGFFLGEHGLAGKWYPYQESIRVPLIIRDPRMPKEKRGTLDDSFTLNIDLAETILGAANLLPHERMQGRNIADLYLKPDGKETWRKEFFYQHQSMGKDYIPASSALVRKDFKYLIYPEWKVEQLFDMVNDPLEFHDIVNRSEYSALVDEMRKRHDELAEQVK